MSNQSSMPHILVKSDLRNGRSDLFDEHDDVLRQLGAIGIFGTEVAVTVTGDAETDTVAIRRATAWAERWYDAGLQVYIHPYTSGPANPAVCTGERGGSPHDFFRLVADEAAKLTERTKDLLVLTYHAASHSGEENDGGPENGPGLRKQLLERSIRFFDLGFRYCEQVDPKILLVSETQLPPEVGSPRIRIGDRPEEVLATLSGRGSGACWDTGHYLLSIERVGISPDPAEEFVNAVTHMHIHDVIDSVDHRPLTKESARVARYVHAASQTGSLNSITLEYDYRLDREATGATEGQRLLDHLKRTVELVHTWCAAGDGRRASEAS